MLRLNVTLRLMTKFSWNRAKFLIFQQYKSKNQIVLIRKSFGTSVNQSTANNELKEESESDSETNSQEKEKLTGLRLQILHAGLNFVPEHGWSKKSIALGAQSIGLSAASHTLITDEGADLVHYFNFLCNENLSAYLESHASEITKEKNIQEYIECALEKRLTMVYPYVSRWDEALSLMAFPTQAPSDLQNLLKLVDIIWSYSVSKDLNATWYSKRLSLALAYRLCEMSLIQDKTPEYSRTLEFLKKHVGNVVYSDEVLQQIISSGQHFPKYCQGALTTMQNIFGLNRLLR